MMTTTGRTDPGDVDDTGRISPQHRIHLDGEVSLLFKKYPARTDKVQKAEETHEQSIETSEHSAETQGESAELASMIQNSFRMLKERTNFRLNKRPRPNEIESGTTNVSTEQNGQSHSICIEENAQRGEEIEKPSMIPRRMTGRRKASPPDPPKNGPEMAPHQLTRLTLDNTKKNALYTRVELLVEPVRLEAARPESPERKWTPKTFLSDFSDMETEEEEEGLRLRWNRKLTILDECPTANAPLSPSISIPVKPILKKQPAPSSSLSTANTKEKIVVKKLIYANDVEDEDEEERFVVEDILEGSVPEVSKAVVGGRRRKHKKGKVEQSPPQRQDSMGKPRRVPKKK